MQNTTAMIVFAQKMTMLALTIFLLLMVTVIQPIRASHKLPDMEQDNYCFGCQALVEVLDNTLRPPGGDQVWLRVVDALDTVCASGNYDNYDLREDKLIKACKQLLSYHDDELEEFLIEQYSAEEGDRLSREDLQKRVCKSMTGACSGVDIRSIRSLMQAQSGKNTKGEKFASFKTIKPVMPGEKIEL